jgi:ribosome-interacting GTPase 1
MSLLELKERLDFLFKELYNYNISLDDAREEIEIELKEFMPSTLYHTYIKQLDEMEEQTFQEDWNISDDNFIASGEEMDW